MQNGEPGSSPFCSFPVPWRAESRAIGSHRKSGVQIGVKNLSPVESCFPPSVP
jgi:hypothetical protein